MKWQAADHASSICKFFASDVLLSSTLNVRRVARHLYWEIQGKPQSTLRALTPSAVPYFHIHTWNMHKDISFKEEECSLKSVLFLSWVHAEMGHVWWVWNSFYFLEISSLFSVTRKLLLWLFIFKCLPMLMLEIKLAFTFYLWETQVLYFSLICLPWVL